MGSELGCRRVSRRCVDHRFCSVPRSHCNEATTKITGL
ncbi:hypothetical protein HF086_009958 [Spodoptera exigua]|uniref:Uncharacterized protein n=1 Tax=Spodoptera exigua TaxID=7107 RepID=A0A922MUG2_SPOEX|nr:hypothetical protein HF086_009958 [Spodoptera exigua]